MAGIILNGTPSTVCHTFFTKWVNTLLSDYVNGFWDEAIKSIIELTFIKRNALFLQEIYQADGQKLSGFITGIPGEGTFILMVHELGSGKPILYNKNNGPDLFTFDSEGRLKQFGENLTIALYNESGDNTHECFIYADDRYGIRTPFYVVRQKVGAALLGQGIIDIPYAERGSGTYGVVIEPTSDIPKYDIINNSKGKIVLDIPIVVNQSSRYELRSGGLITIPVTESSREYVERMKELLDISIKEY